MSRGTRRIVAVVRSDDWLLSGNPIDPETGGVIDPQATTMEMDQNIAELLTVRDDDIGSGGRISCCEMQVVRSFCKVYNVAILDFAITYHSIETV